MHLEELIVPLIVVASLAFCAASTLFVHTAMPKKERGKTYDADAN